MSEKIIEFEVTKNGEAYSIYNDEHFFRNFSHLKMKRATYVEPNNKGQWIVDMSPINGSKIAGVFNDREEALAFERKELNRNLGKGGKFLFASWWERILLKINIFR